MKHAIMDDIQVALSEYKMLDMPADKVQVGDSGWTLAMLVRVTPHRVDLEHVVPELVEAWAEIIADAVGTR
jgi:hypothetical protein